MADVLAQLGWKRILMVSQSDGKYEEAMTLARNGIHVSSTGKPCEIGQKYQQYLDGIVLEMRAFNEALFQETMKCGCREAFRILLIVTNNGLENVREALRRNNESKGLITLVMPAMKLMRTIKMAFNTETVLMPYMSTEYDFLNMTMDCYFLPFHPVIDYDCHGSNCKVSGTYPDIIEYLGKQYNFRLSYQLEPSGKWGSPSNLGENDTSILKSLHNGQSAFSFPWVGTYERLQEFDHILGIPIKIEMYMMHSGPKLAIDMVFQPFTTLVWVLIAVFMGLVTFGKMMLNQRKIVLGELKKFKYSLALLVGLFMSVTIAFYRSSMAVALMAKQPIPFESLIDGLADPDWNLVYLKDSEGMFEPYYRLIPGGKKREDIIINPNYKYIALSRLEKFQQLTNPQTFMVEDRLRASHFLRNTKCQECKDAIHFGKQETKNTGFLFEKHSPLQEIFKNGMVHMRETGAIDQIKQSLGPDYMPQTHQSKSPLTIQLMAMLLISIGLVALVICPTVLAMEHFWNWLVPRLQINYRNPNFYECKIMYKESVCEHCGLKKIRQEVCVK